MLEVLRHHRFAVLVILAALIALLLAMHPGRAHADHGVTVCGTTGTIRACLARSSAFVDQYVKPGREVTYCFNQDALNYPDFARQMRLELGYYMEDLHVPAREVAFPSNSTDMSCVMRLVMRWDHPCSGCAAWVYTQNLPVLVEFNAQTGITDWGTTGGHEEGHAYCLLDEHYDKPNFRSFILTYGYWIHGRPTVMDAGTPYVAAYAPRGIYRLTDYDKERCSETLGRDVTTPPPVDPCADGLYDPSWRATWKPCVGTGQWVSVSGWAWQPSDDTWWYQGQRFWESCNADRLRYEPVDNIYGAPGQYYYSLRASVWATTPGC